MVEDRITDGKRIAQLLASELTGIETPPMDRVEVVDATPDAEPSPEGTEAYSVALDGDRIGTVTAYPDAAVLSVRGSLPDGFESAEGLGVDVGDGRSSVRIEYGAAVKGAVDLLIGTVDE